MSIMFFHHFDEYHETDPKSNKFWFTSCSHQSIHGQSNFTHLNITRKVGVDRHEEATGFYVAHKSLKVIFGSNIF